MINKSIIKIVSLALAVLSCNISTVAQGFNGLTPLESTCEDVKRILKVKECILPFSVYYLKDYTVSMHFTKDKLAEGEALCYKVPAGMVSSIIVSYNNPFPVKDFEYELEYDEGPFGDIETISYQNLAKGITVFTNLGRINTAIFGPTPEQNRKFSYKCSAIL